MKRIACVLPILAGVPGALAGQVNIALPRLQAPVVRATLGPVALVASLKGPGVSVHAAPSSPKRRTAPASPRTTGATASAAQVLAVARQYVGTRYSYGGDSPAEGFDCSGFVQYVFGRQGVELPRTSRLQASAGERLSVAVDSLRPGDLLFFASTGAGVNHVAIYAGNNRIIHSTAGAGQVVYDDLTSARGKWYLKRHVASRRVL
ncbi:MAG TPA: C40 family peptidase [Gemmatimonadales bacterium]